MGVIEYREAILNDCNEIARVKGEVWNTTYRGIYSDEDLDNYDVSKNAALFSELIACPDIALYVAADSGKIAGYMSCGMPRRAFGDYKQEIGLLYVLKDYQKRGIGRQLFNIGKDRILANGYNEFFISVNKYNTNALDFYVAMGGKIIHIDEDSSDRRNVQIKLHYAV